MARRNELAFLFFESYWETLNKALKSKKKRADMAYALIEAFFTGKSQADKFSGTEWGMYSQLEDEMWYSRSQAMKGRTGGQAERKPKVQPNGEPECEPDGEPNGESNANPKTKTNKKEKINKKENRTTSQTTASSSTSICPKCHVEHESVSPGVFRCPSCDITWTVRAG